MSANATALRQARATATPCAGRSARTGPVRVMAVAVPRKVQGASSAPSARPSARTEKAALTAMAITETAAMVHLINASSFQDFLAQHADKLVVCDFYAVWCGPCKMIAPELERLANELDPSKVVFAKMDCGADNESKKLAMSLGIKALPTFHLYREARLADTMTGAKVKSLEQLIHKHA